jgi:hypothetical protein
MPPYDAAIPVLIVMANHFLKPPLLDIVTAIVAYAVFRQFYIPLVAKSQATKPDEDKG